MIHKGYKQELKELFVHHVQSSTVHSSQDRDAVQASTGTEWMNKTRNTHTMEYYSALKGKKF